MITCPKCEFATEEDTCPACGCPIPSEPTDMMDTLVQRASIPNLASLFRAGKKAGLIQPAKEYGNS